MGGLSWAAHQLGLRVAAGVDLNKTAIRTFAVNFPLATAIQGSVRSSKVLRQCSQLLAPPGEPPAPSVIVSGPPCQGFSAAGSRDPADPRNQLLVAVARAIVVLNPQCALVENVAAVLAPKHEERLRRFEDTLCANGFSVFKVLLDAADFGVPQKRKRAFFLISRQDIGEHGFRSRLRGLQQPRQNVAAALGGLPKPAVRPDDYDDERDYGVIPNHFAMQHSRRVMKKIASLQPGTGPMSYRRLDPAKPSNTLFSGHRAPPAHYSEPRSITVREAARLQGFPDDFRVYGSFANQMEQVTNAVPPPLAAAVLEVLLDLAGVLTQ